MYGIVRWNAGRILSPKRKSTVGKIGQQNWRRWLKLGPTGKFGQQNRSQWATMVSKLGASGHNRNKTNNIQEPSGKVRWPQVGIFQILLGFLIWKISSPTPKINCVWFGRLRFGSTQNKCQSTAHTHNYFKSGRFACTAACWVSPSSAHTHNFGRPKRHISKRKSMQDQDLSQNRQQ